MPASFEVCETFTPPRPVNCGVFGKFKKLKAEFPPNVCALVNNENNNAIIKIDNRTDHEYEKSFPKKQGSLFQTIQKTGIKLKLLHKNRGVSF